MRGLSRPVLSVLPCPAQPCQVLSRPFHVIPFCRSQENGVAPSVGWAMVRVPAERHRASGAERLAACATAGLRPIAQQGRWPAALALAALGAAAARNRCNAIRQFDRNARHSSPPRSEHFDTHSTPNWGPNRVRPIIAEHFNVDKWHKNA